MAHVAPTQWHNYTLHDVIKFYVAQLLSGYTRKELATMMGIKADSLIGMQLAGQRGFTIDQLDNLVKNGCQDFNGKPLRRTTLLTYLIKIASDIDEQVKTKDDLDREIKLSSKRGRRPKAKLTPDKTPEPPLTGGEWSNVTDRRTSSGRRNTDVPDGPVSDRRKPR